MSSVAVPTVRTAHRPDDGTRLRGPGVGSMPAPSGVQRRRVVAVAALVVLAFLAAVVLGRIGAEAGIEDRIAGHVVVEPGETLWDVAAATAPDGVDTRQQLADLRALNGIDGSHLDAWAVVLIPAR